jgi:formyl-CoA transferase
VLDFTRVVAGPYCTMLLGDFGADVIKVEEPGGGDELRALGPPFIEGESVFFLSLNRNKRSVAVDLKDPAALARLLGLVRTVDVVVENFRPGVMERLGLGYETLKQLNPRLIYCSISAFASGSRYSDRPGYDLMISGMSGLQSVTGEPGRAPLRPGVNVVDLASGTNATMGVLMALIARGATGVGQKVEVSLMDSIFGLLGQLAGIYLNTGAVPARRAPEDLHGQIVPYGTFLCADGKHLNVCVPNNRFWAALCEVIGRDQWVHDPRFATNADRIANREVLVTLMAKRFGEEPRDRWIELLLGRGIPSGPVNSIDEAVKDGYFAEVGMLAEMVHRRCGSLVLPAIPIRMSGTPGSLRRAPPMLGEHTEEILETPENQAP